MKLTQTKIVIAVVISILLVAALSYAEPPYSSCKVCFPDLRLCETYITPDLDMLGKMVYAAVEAQAEKIQQIKTIKIDCDLPIAAKITGYTAEIRLKR